ncbi:MAG: dihydroxyacetone kinase, partial [Frankiales bacterium]|nr:dihydroxyacetone kinase [Frankiales bacterium]
MLQVLDAAALRQWCTAGLEALTAARQEIDDLNVFPVPDGDTGTNLQLTMAATVQAVLAAPADLAATVAALVQGSLLGARGNSGVILSQLLRGLGEALSAPAGPEELRAALVRSAESAYAAVATPVEGTLLTVAREAAAAATGADLAAVVRSARVAAAAALARTPDL